MLHPPLVARFQRHLIFSPQFVWLQILGRKRAKKYQIIITIRIKRTEAITSYVEIIPAIALALDGSIRLAQKPELLPVGYMALCPNA